nr:hypothetical protein HK105_006264 [Polyrhizophydium stewartii]
MRSAVWPLTWFESSNARGPFGGLTVFPGGAADASDGSSEWAGDAEASGVGSLGITALREAFEETGLLLLAGGSAAAGRQLDGAAAAAWRARVRGDAGQYSALVRELGAAPGVRRLVPWSRWVTPAFEPKRFDTLFFLATVAPRAAAGDAAALAHLAPDGGETLALAWLTPADALAALRRQEITMLPPQFLMLRELAGMSFAQLQALSAAPATARRDMRPIQPELVGTDGDGNPVLALPGDAKHSMTRAASGEARNRITLVRKDGRTIDLVHDKSGGAARL